MKTHLSKIQKIHATIIVVKLNITFIISINLYTKITMESGLKDIFDHSYSRFIVVINSH